MEIRKLGRTDLKVSVVGLGCNNFGMIGIEETRKVVHRALDSGITLFDTADIYGAKYGASEAQLGEVLGDRRKDIVLATKFGMAPGDGSVAGGAARAYILQAAEGSLKRLKTDWIDLYQLHRPDPKTPIEETLRALDDLKSQGKVRHVGCSNMPAWKVADAVWTARAQGFEGFVSCQDEYSLLVRRIEQGLIPAMQYYDLALLPYFPLASGLLTGKYKRGTDVPADTRFAVMKRLADRYLTEENWNIVERLEAFCAERGKNLLTLAFSWLASRPQLASVIAGARKAEQIDQNIAATGWKLTADELAEIDRITGTP